METTRAAAFNARVALPTSSVANLRRGRINLHGGRRKWTMVSASLETGSGTGGGSNGKKIGVPNSNYVVPLDMAGGGLTRPLNEILRDLNKRVPDKIINHENNSILWYHANRMLSFYAPGSNPSKKLNTFLSNVVQGWCGEVRDVTFSGDGSVTVVYRITIRGSDGEAHRESTGSVSSRDSSLENPVSAAEEIAFCRACARFGFGLYLYHVDEAL